MTEDVYGRYRDTLRLGHQYAAAGRFKEALGEYRTAATVAERALPHVGVGAMHLRLGQAREALPAFERALELEPDNIDALSGRAAALLATGRRAEAASIRDRITALQVPHQVPGTQGGALPLAAAEANAVAGDQARAAGNNDAAIDAWMVESSEHVRAGHYDAALDACLRALVLDSGALRVHLAMIHVYVARGWDARATQRTTLLDRILTLTPDVALRASLDDMVQARTVAEGQPVRA